MRKCIEGETQKGFDSSEPVQETAAVQKERFSARTCIPTCCEVDVQRTHEITSVRAVVLFQRSKKGVRFFMGSRDGGREHCRGELRTRHTRW